jgi:protein disulfide-isomerase
MASIRPGEEPLVAESASELSIEVWSDLSCPFCYLGKATLDLALAEFAGREAVRITHRAFQLDPDQAVEVPGDNYDFLAAKFGVSRDQAKGITDQVAERAAGVGLAYNMRDLVVTSTRAAHRLSQLALDSGRQHEVMELLFRAHFCEARHIGRVETLVEIAEAAGLDPETARAAVLGDEFEARIDADLALAGDLGIRGVPFFVLDGRLAISGAQESGTFRTALDRAWASITSVDAAAAG